jgi:hypothetical protein
MNLKKISGDKKAQVWVETVIYTLIALGLIAAVLAFAKPKIEEIQDKTILDQTIQVMEELNAQIMSANRGGLGNVRIIELQIKKGSLKIDGANNQIIYTMDETRSQYSERGTTIPYGSLEVLTEKSGKLNTVSLTLDYPQLNVQYMENQEGVKELTESPTLYKLSISNDGVKDAVESGDCSTTMTIVDCAPGENYEVVTCEDSISIPGNDGCFYQDPRTQMSFEVL